MDENHEKPTTMMEDIAIPIAMFAMIFGCVYVAVTSKHRQRMALIEKGMDPSLIGGSHRDIYRSLRLGLLAVGIGVGLFLGRFLDRAMFAGAGEDTPIAYFITTLLCGGVALLAYHFLVRNKQQG